MVISDPCLDGWCSPAFWYYWDGEFIVLLPVPSPLFSSWWIICIKGLPTEKADDMAYMGIRQLDMKSDPWSVFSIMLWSGHSEGKTKVSPMEQEFSEMGLNYYSLSAPHLVQTTHLKWGNWGASNGRNFPWLFEKRLFSHSFPYQPLLLFAAGYELYHLRKISSGHSV